VLLRLCLRLRETIDCSLGAVGHALARLIWPRFASALRVALLDEHNEFL
jgi:hypothetical protein